MATNKQKDVPTTEADVMEQQRLAEAEKLEERDDVVTVASQQVRVNTTASMRGGVKTNAELANETKEALKKFSNEKTVKVSIPSVLAPKLGSVQFISVNGVSVNVPVDGEEYPIPETHANFLKQYLKELK